MDFIYILLHNNSDWEDITIFLSEEDAINESKKFPESRIEIFSKKDKSGYKPTYNYYKNGEYFKNT